MRVVIGQLSKKIVPGHRTGRIECKKIFASCCCYVTNFKIVNNYVWGLFSIYVEFKGAQDLIIFEGDASQKISSDRPKNM